MKKYEKIRNIKENKHGIFITTMFRKNTRYRKYILRNNTQITNTKINKKPPLYSD